MKHSILFSMLVIVIALLIFAHAEEYPFASPTTLDFSTSTNQLAVDQSTDLSISVADAQGAAVDAGSVSLYQLQSVQTYGDSAIANQIIVASPEFTFTATATMNISGIKIPVQGITVAAKHINWEIYREIPGLSSIVVGKGDIFFDDVQDQINSSQAIWLLFNSYQTQNTGITMTDDFSIYKDINYRVVLDASNTPCNFTFATVTNGSLPINEGAIPTGSYGSLELLHGTTFYEASLTGAPLTTKWQAATVGTYSLVAQYQGSFLYGPSFSLQEVYVQSAHPLQILPQNASVIVGATSELTATLMQDSVPMVNSSVEFAMGLGGSWHPLGIGIVDDSGTASISFIAEYPPDMYTYRTAATDGKEYTYAFAFIRVLPSQLTVNASELTASYNPSGTQLQINLQVQNESSLNPVANAHAVFAHASSELLALNSSASGMLSTQLIVPLQVGYYLDYLSLSLTHPDFTSAIIMLDINVLKNNLTITAHTNLAVAHTIKYDEQPIYVFGTVSTSSSFVNTSLAVQKRLINDSQWIPVGTVAAVAGNFNFSYSESVVGDYVLQVTHLEDAEYLNATSNSVYIFLLAGDAYITAATNQSGTTADPIQITFDSSAEIGVYVKDYNYQPLVNAAVTFSIPSESNGIFIYNTIVVQTDNNGWASFVFSPDRSVYSYALQGSAAILVHAEYPNYVVESIALYWNISKTTVQLAVTTSNATYNHPVTFTIQATTAAGLSLPLGTPLQLTILGQEYQVLIAEPTQLQLTLFTVGTVNYTVTIVESWAFHTTSFVSILTVNKANITILSDNLEGTTGATVNYSATVKDGNQSLTLPLELWVQNDTTWVHETSVTSINGTAYYTQQLTLYPGIYFIQWRFFGTENYSAVTAQYSLTVTTIISQLSIDQEVSTYYYGVTPHLQILLQDALGIPLINQAVHVSLNATVATYTTDFQGSISFTFPSLAVGFYTFNISFAGSGYYTSASLFRTIVVQGLPLEVNWVESPTNSFYNESTTMTFQVVDSNSHPIQTTVTIAINQQLINFQTNASGYIIFSTLLQEGTYNISLLFASNYTVAAQEFTITVTKDTLNVTYNIDNATAIIYGSQFIVTGVLSDSRGNLVGMANVTAVIASTTTSVIYYCISDSDGYFMLAINSSAFQEGDTITLSLFYNHAIYQSKSDDLYIALEAETAQLTVITASLNYGEVGTLLFKLENQFAQPLAGYITNFYLNSRFIGSATTNDNGYLLIEVLPTDVGTLSLTYQITSADLQLLPQQLTITVRRGIPTLSVQQIVVNATAMLNISSSALSSILSVDVWNGTAYIPFYSAEIFLFTIIPFVTAELHYRISLTATNYYNATSIEFIPTVQISQYSIQNTQVEVLDAFNPQVNSLNYFADVYININTSFIYWGSINSSAPVLPTQYPAGSYAVLFIFKATGWYSAVNTTITLTIYKRDLTITSSLNELYADSPNQFTAELSSNGMPVANQTVYFAYFNGSTWVDLSAAVTNASGIADFTISVAAGFWECKFYVQSAIYETIISKHNFQVQSATHLQVIGTENTQVVVQLVFGNFTEIATANISLFIENAGALVVMQIALTNSSGFAVFNLPSDLLPANYSIKLWFEGSSLLTASNYVYLPYTVAVRSVELLINNITDNGYNETLEIFIRDGTTYIQTGTIQWRLLDAEHIIATGNVTIINGSALLVLQARDYLLIGNYTLVISFESAQFTAQDFTIPIYWQPITIITPTVQTTYPATTVDVSFYVQSPLTTYVKVQFLDQEYSVQTNAGMALITLQLEGVLVGNYSLKIYASLSSTFQTFINVTGSVIYLAGEQHINCNILGSYFDEYLRVDFITGNSTTFDVRIADLTFNNISYNDLQTLNLSVLGAGVYNITLTMYSNNYLPFIYTCSIALLPIPVTIHAEATTDNMLQLQLTVIDNRTQQIVPDPGNFVVVMTNNTGNYSYYFNSSVFSLPLSSVTIAIYLQNNYVGSIYLLRTLPQNTEKSSHFPFGELIGTAMVFILLPILKQITPRIKNLKI